MKIDDYVEALTECLNAETEYLEHEDEAVEVNDETLADHKKSLAVEEESLSAEDNDYKDEPNHLKFGCNVPRRKIDFQCSGEVCHEAAIAAGVVGGLGLVATIGYGVYKILSDSPNDRLLDA